MSSLLSRLAFWWAALAVGLSLLLPAPLGTGVAALAVAAAGLSLWAGGSRRRDVAPLDAQPTALMDDAGWLDIAAMVVRCCTQAHDLSEALHSVARVLFQQLGADGLVTGRVDAAGALSLDRFIDHSAVRATTPPASMSALAAEAAAHGRVAGDQQRGFAVPVLRAGRCVAWLEFSGVRSIIAAATLRHLLDLVCSELSAVAQRCATAPARPGALDQTLAAPAEPDAKEARLLLTRYMQPQPAPQGAAPARRADVIDPNALNRLRELDPSGTNRLIERVVKAFDASTTRLMPQLRDAAHSGDLPAVRQVAHTLKSASASVGALALSRLCAELEACHDADDGATLAGRIDATIAESDVVLSVLRSLPAPPRPDASRVVQT